MPSQSRNLKQAITRWTVSTDGFGGFTFGIPETFHGRWEDRNTTFRDNQGNEVVSNATVYLEKDVEVGDYLYCGESADADPTKIGGKRVMQFNKITNLRNTEVQRKVFL